MGEPSVPEPVQLIVGLLAASPELLDEARVVLAEQIGVIESASEPYLWTESAYYNAEMGPVIWRQLVAVGRCIDPAALADVKRQTNDLERRWRDGSGRRRVNLDPGYLGVTKLVLATTKDAAHRVYLRDGIYAEATLHYANGSWHPYAHTYRDYAGAVALAFFKAVRSGYVARRRLAAGAAASPAPAGCAETAAPPGEAPSRPPRAAGRA
jgi:hypothetical protein